MNPKNKILYLHVGGQKTGSTELQRFFLDNAEWLKSKGILYPLTGMHLSEQLRLSWASREFVQNYTNHYTKTKSAEDYWKLLSLDKAIQNSNVLISAEGFYLDFHPKNNNKYINLIKKLFPNHTIKIILYIREQFSLLSSLRNEYLKTGYTEDSLCTASKEEYFNGQIKLGLCHYNAWLENMSELILPADLHVRVYDRNTLVGQDVVEDILSVIGLTHKGEIIRQDTDANPRIHNDLIETLFLNLGRDLSHIPHRSRARLYKQLLKVSPFQSTNSPKTNVTSSEVLPSFCDENEKLRVKYFPNLSSLFTPKSVVNTEVNNEGNVAYASKLISDLWINSENNQKILIHENNALISKIHRLSEREKHDEKIDVIAPLSENDEYEELYFRKNLANIEYQLFTKDCRNVALYGFNDISVALYHSLISSSVSLICYIDQKASWHNLAGVGAGIPSHSLSEVDFNLIDTVILCTESSAISMENDLLHIGFTGNIITYTG